MALDQASVHAVLGLLDLHSFKTLEHAVEQFRAHKQRFHESLSELKSLKPSAGIPPVAFSQPSCQGMQERCTPRITATGADSLSVSTQMRCTPLKPPLSSMIVQEGIENCGYSLRPRASRKHDSSGAPQRITRSRAKQPATNTARACNNSRKSEFIVLEDDFVEITRSCAKQPATITAGACNNSRKSEFIVLEDDFVEITRSHAKQNATVTAGACNSLRKSEFFVLEDDFIELEAKASSKPGQHQQASFQHECPIEAAVSLTPQLVQQMTLSNKGYSVTPCQNAVNCNRKHLHMEHGEGACDGSFSKGHLIDADACALSSVDPVLSLTGRKQLQLLSPHFVQQIPSLHKGPTSTPCQNIINCSREHLSAHHAEGANIGSFSRNQSIGTHAIVYEKSSPARAHLPTTAEQSSKQIIDVVHCEVNQEKSLPTDAEDGANITCSEKDNALALRPSSISLRHSLPSTCQEFNGTDTIQSNSHKRKLSVFEGSRGGIVLNDDVKRRKRYSSSINSIEIEAFKFDLVDDAYFDKEGSKHLTLAASLCKENRRSLCVQGDHDQARPSAFKRLSTTGINDSAKVHKFKIDTAETGIDWHANSVALEKPCGILSEVHSEPAGSGAYDWDNTLQRDIQERKSALPDSFQVVTHNLHGAHEVIEHPHENLRDTYIEECNKESQTEASEKQDGLGLECACADKLLLSNGNSPAWHTSLQGVLKDVQGGKLTSPDSFQATTQKLPKTLEITEPPFDNPKDTHIQEFNDESQHEAFEKQDNLMFKCACAEQLLSSDLNSSTQDNSLQGVSEDIQEEKLATPDACQGTAQELYRAQEMIEPSFDNLKDLQIEECSIGFQSEASEKQDDLVLECSQADQLLPSNLNSPAVCLSAKVQPEEGKMCSLSNKTWLRLTTSAEVQPCGHELAEGPSTSGINDSAEVKGFSIGRVEIGLDWPANSVASEKPCGILSQAHYEAAGSRPHIWDNSVQGVLKDIEEGKPALPESFQVTPQKLDQVHVAMDFPLDNSRDTSMEVCNNESQSEASETQDGLVLECAHADQPLLSNSGSPAVCFSLKVQPEQNALSSRGNAIGNDYLPSRTGFNSLQMQVKSSNKLCKSYCRLSGLQRECIDTPHMNPARVDFADRASTKFRSFECRLDSYLEDGKENQTPEPWLKDKVYNGTGLPSEKQATVGTRKVLGCSNQSFGGLVESAHKRYNLAVETRSFLDFVQQKQLPLPYPNGKRDVRVKALEAAELARREEERRENERKMRRLECNEAKGAELEGCKEKMIPSCASTITAKGVTEKVKRVAELKMKMDQEKAKKQEVEQKKKEEERKKKEAEIADKKRKREDADRKDREEKRKRVEEVQKLKKEQEERQRLELEEKEHKRKVLEERERERKAQEEEAKKLRRLQKEREAERRRKQEQHLKASRLAEKQAERKRKEAMLKARGYEDDTAAQLALGNKLSILSTESFAISTSTDWEAQSKSTMRTRSQTSEDRWGFRVPSLGASVYGQTNNGKLSTSAGVVGNGTPFPMNTVKNEAGFKFEASKSLKSQYSTPFSLKLGAHAPAQQAHLESNIQSYEISPYKSSSSDDEDEDDQPKKPIPLWARKENLLPQILWQQCMDPDDIFSTEKTCSLAEIFGTTGSRRCKDFTQRSTSGDWLYDHATWKEELEYKQAMGYIEG